MKKLAISFGTRPELIKILPVFRGLVDHYGRETILLIHTGQHSDLLESDLAFFNLSPDVKFDLKRSSGSLSELTGNLLLQFEKLKERFTVEGIEVSAFLAQGDTASTYISALNAFHQQIPFFHIEAGLRTYDSMNPFPEEFYRRSISEMTSLHFAPTETESKQLIKELKRPEDITVTGNTVIDHLVNLERNSSCKEVIITLHRRELSCSEYQGILDYFRLLVPDSPDWNFKWIKHPNRNMDFAGLEDLPNFELLDPVPFNKFLELYKTAGLIFTDSGGIQEEAGYLGIPCIVCRKATERTQGIDSGVAKLFDPSFKSIDKIQASFDHENLKPRNTIYGDGKSAERIVNAVKARIAR